EVEGEQHRAGEQGRERHEVADPRRGLVSPVAQAQQGGDRIRPAGEPAEEEVEQDVPRPLRTAGEVVDHGFGSSSGATSGSSTATAGAAVATAGAGAATAGSGSRRRRSVTSPPSTA